MFVGADLSYFVFETKKSVPAAPKRYALLIKRCKAANYQRIQLVHILNKLQITGKRDARSPRLTPGSAGIKRGDPLSLNAKILLKHSDSFLSLKGLVYR